MKHAERTADRERTAWWNRQLSRRQTIRLVVGTISAGIATAFTAKILTYEPEEKIRHRKLLEILGSLGKPGFASFHPQGASDEHPARPLYAIALRKRWETDSPETQQAQNLHEYGVFLTLADMHQIAGVQIIAAEEIPGNEMLKRREDVSPLAPEEVGRILKDPAAYETFLQSQKLIQGKRMTPIESAALLFPTLKVVGAGVVLHPEDRKVLPEFSAQYRELADQHQLVQDAYVAARKQGAAPPICKPVERNGKIVAVQIGDRIFDNPQILLLNARMFLDQYERLAQLQRRQSMVVAQNVNSVFVGSASAMHFLEEDGPAHGRSVFLARNAASNYTKLLGESPFTHVENAKALLRELEVIGKSLEIKEEPLPRVKPVPGRKIS